MHEGVPGVREALEDFEEVVEFGRLEGVEEGGGGVEEAVIMWS